MNLFLTVDGRNRAMFDSEVKEAFGLDPKAKWPAGGMPLRYVQGIECWVDPLRIRNSTRRPHFGLRAMCRCPKCLKTMPIGRLHQHSKVHR